MGLRKFLEDFVHFKPVQKPDQRDSLPIVNNKDEVVSQLSASTSRVSSLSQLNEFRTIADDRNSQYNIYDEMANDSVIAAALEMYADDATAYDEQGRIIWVESDDEEIARAGNRLLEKFEIPERAWKHIYQACKYGDSYLKIYRKSDMEDKSEDPLTSNPSVKIVNDTVVEGDRKVIYPYDNSYVEDVYDPATIFDLRKRGKTAGFIEVTRDMSDNTLLTATKYGAQTHSLKDVKVYRPDRFIHIMISENFTRSPETITMDFDNEDGETTSVTYEVARGKSILYDVYPVQRELQLLEDSLLLNRLTRSSLIRLLEIEIGDMPKKEVNNFLRRMKNLIEQHISFDKNTGDYQSYQSPGPIDNCIYIPVRNGKGSISINNLGGDVNVRDIADIDYFSNKRSGALKIPRAYLGDDNQGSQLDNGGTLTQLSARYARTIKRVQTAYIRAITTLLNFFFIDMDLDYVNKFQVRMTSPSAQEDIQRNELISGNVELISSIMSLLESLEGGTQKKVLEHLITDILKMPELAALIREDDTPDEDVSVDGEMSSPDFGGGDFDSDFGGFDDEGSRSDSTIDMSSEFDDEGTEESGGEEGFTSQEYSSFEDF